MGQLSGPSRTATSTSHSNAEANFEDIKSKVEANLAGTSVKSDGKQVDNEPRDQPRYTPSGVDYERKYRPPPYGEELSADARVWSAYNDEAQIADADMMKGLNGTLDVLLVFAGLFSAVVTTFVAQSSQSLSPDYLQVTASLVYELTRIQRAVASGTPVSDVPFSQINFDKPGTYARTDLWVNVLWLTSLTLSLLTSLISVLAKQWIQQFNSIAGGTPRDRAYTRQYRLWAFERWKVPIIIGALPLLLTIALLLFLAGLSVYVVPMNFRLSCVIIAFSAATFLFCAVTTALPIVAPHCPYKTPVSDYIIVMAHLVFQYGVLDPIRLLCLPYHIMSAKKSDSGDSWKERAPWSISRPAPQQVKSRELHDQRRRHSFLIVEALKWLSSSSFNTSAASISTQVVSALPLDTSYKDAPAKVLPYCQSAEEQLTALGSGTKPWEASLKKYTGTIERLTEAAMLQKPVWSLGIWKLPLWDEIYCRKKDFADHRLGLFLRVALLMRSCDVEKRDELSTVRNALEATDTLIFPPVTLQLHALAWREL
ncbi:hypothetical protein EV122DRAFT_202022, partial [Schizophyllum commune]